MTSLGRVPYSPGPTTPTPVQQSGSGATRGPLSGGIGTTVVLGLLVVVLVAGFVVLELSGRDVVSYVAFASGPAVVAIVGSLLNRRQAQMASDLGEIKTQTGDVITAKFAEASAERAAMEARRQLAAQQITHQIDLIPTVLPHPASDQPKGAA